MLEDQINMFMILWINNLFMIVWIKDFHFVAWGCADTFLALHDLMPCCAVMPIDIAKVGLAICQHLKHGFWHCTFWFMLTCADCDCNHCFKRPKVVMVRILYLLVDHISSICTWKLDFGEFFAGSSWKVQRDMCLNLSKENTCSRSLSEKTIILSAKLVVFVMVQKNQLWVWTLSDHHHMLSQL